jgi:hypothetical protein
MIERFVMMSSSIMTIQRGLSMVILMLLATVAVLSPALECAAESDRGSGKGRSFVGGTLSLSQEESAQTTYQCDH